MAESLRAKRKKTISEAPKQDHQIGKKQNTRGEPSKETNEGDSGKITPRIMVQCGGYYILVYPERAEDVLKVMVEATQSGYDILKNNGTAVDAVEKTVSILEDDHNFNAGFGSLLNVNGEVECDAMIMDGFTLNTGAVMGAQHFKNPVSISRKIMDESDHCALTGEGAWEFAQSKGFETCWPEDLISDEVRSGRKKFETVVKKNFTGGHDTVTAIALDSNGHFACATSTGGIPGKLKGRIGDAPLVGCGGYANEYGAAGTSGRGEELMKMTLAREVVYNMERGQSAQESTKNAVQKLENRIRGLGSAIAIDVNGNFGKATNSPVMLWAQIADDSVEYGHERKKKID